MTQGSVVGPGLVLCEFYYWEAVRPIIDRHFPGLRHAAALVGYGSDVLGFDDKTSQDHMWGPRLELFLEPADFEAKSDALDAMRLGSPRRSTRASTPSPAGTPF